MYNAVFIDLSSVKADLFKVSKDRSRTEMVMKSATYKSWKDACLDYTRVWFLTPIMLQVPF